MAVAGRVALITGSTSAGSIGYGIAKSLARNGYSIILHGRRNAEEVEPLRERLEKENNVAVNYLEANLLKRSEIEIMCKKIKPIYPAGVDVLVNNAALYGYKTEEFPVEKWDEIIATNMTAPFDLTRLLLSDMKKKGWGRIINISSVRSKSVSPGSSVAYAASKHGLNGLTKVTAAHSLGTGVTCNAICPAYVETQLIGQKIERFAEKYSISHEEAKKRLLLGTNPSGEFVQVEQVAEMAAFLCTPAADQITGAEIPIDAGSWAM